MKIRLIILFTSILTAVLLLAAGYGLWEERLVIKGYINVVRPEVETLIIPKELPQEEEPLPGEEVETVTPGGITVEYTGDDTENEETDISETGGEDSVNGEIEGNATGDEGADDNEGADGSVTGGIDTAAEETGYDAENTGAAPEMGIESSTGEGEDAVE